MGRKKAPGKGGRGRMQSKKASLSALSPGIRNSALVSDVKKLDLTWALKVTTISDSNAKVKKAGVAPPPVPQENIQLASPLITP